MLNRWIWICFAVTAKVVIGTGTANAVDEEGGKETYAPDYSLQAVPVLDVPTKENTEHFPLPEGFGTRAVGTGDTQPQGALSGKILFLNGGHGYLYDSRWRFARGNGFGLTEDLGNVDQLTHFAYYAFNAGATIVPMRPIGNQTNEVIVDNTSPSCEFFGSWSNSSQNRYYGADSDTIRYRFTNSSAVESAFARYTPTIPAAGYYPVYTWAKNGTNQVKDQLYRINHSGGTKEIRINHRYVGCGWIYLGSYYFEAGTGGSVEISNQSLETGIVVADAIRFGNGMGNIDRGGGVSGRPREDEASRYWIQASMTNTASRVTSVYDTAGSNDESDNVNAPPYMAAHMNDATQGSITDRVFISFHSNAKGGISIYERGADGLWNNESLPSIANGTKTPNQQLLAHLIGEAVNRDMYNLRNKTEFAWIDRSLHDLYRTDYAFGEIRWDRINREMDATIIEVAYHDNAEDAAIMLDPKGRSWIARSTLKGTVRYFNQVASSSLAFLPDSPHTVIAQHTGGGNVTLRWSPAEVNSATGGVPSGYRIYQSKNGYGFGNPVTVTGGETLSATVTTDVNEVTYYKVTAYNDGGESLPSETVGVRPGATASTVLMVNGFDRIDRELNPDETMSGNVYHRVKPWKSNSFDYVVQHGRALNLQNISFDTASKNALNSALLANYQCVVWIAGNQSVKDKTIDAERQILLSTYLESGKSLFISGSDVAKDLNSTPAGKLFLENVLGTVFIADTADSNRISGVPGVPYFPSDIAFGTPAPQYNTAFPPPAGYSPYAVKSADILSPHTIGTDRIIAQYITGTSTGKAAGICRDNGIYKTVLLGFPFETVHSEVFRNNIMQNAMHFLISGNSSVLGWELY